MPLLLLFLLLSVVGVAALIWRRARVIANLTRRLESDAIEPRSTYPTIVIAPGRHLRTAHVATASHLDWLGPPPGVAGELGVTERELVLSVDGRDLVRIPLMRAVDAAFVREFEGHQADTRVAFLRVVWTRGGEQLSTTFAVDTAWPHAEKLRREIHLRLGARPG